MADEKKQIRWGLFGSGKICNDFSIALSTLPATEHKITYASSKNLERAKTFAAKFNIPNATDNYENVAKSPEVDVIYIGTLNPTHKDLSMLAMNHGKAVLCEKPVAMNSKELEEVLQCAKKNNVFFMEAFWTRFIPTWNEVLQKLKSGAYEDCMDVYCTFGYKIFNAVERLNNPDMGGSVLLDIGVYSINAADMVFGGLKLKQLKASAHVDEKSGLDRSVCVTMLYEENKTAQIHASGDQQLDNECIIYCGDKKITVNFPFHAPESYSIHTFSSKETIKYTTKFPLAQHKTVFINSVGLRYEAEHVRQCLLNNKTESDVMSFETSKRIMGYMDDIRQQIGVKFKQDH